MIRAGVAPANVDRTIASIDEEVRTHRAGTASRQSELADVEAVPDWLDAAEPRDQRRASPSFLHTAEFFGLGLDYDLRAARPARRS